MRLLQAALLLSLAANVICAQDYVKRLRSPATTRGFIGGESHDSYVIHAGKGQTMTVQISWRPEYNKDYGRDNEASFWVGELREFNGDGAVKFGKESNGGKRWKGKIPRTGNYYIYVMAHPVAHYTLRVRLQ